VDRQEPLDSPTVVFVADGHAQAHLLRNALEQQGIRALVTNESLQTHAGELPMGMPTALRVVVASRDRQAAREIIEELEEALDEPLDEADEDEAADDEAAPWPRCPSCGRRRHTSCPICGTAGSQFPHAFLPSGAEQPAGAAPLVVCTVCDEPFAAEFPARCEWCGHRFADGRQTPPPAARVDVAQEFNARVGLVLAGLALVGAALVLWGWYIAPRF
jgi:rubrerythrin